MREQIIKGVRHGLVIGFLAASTGLFGAANADVASAKSQTVCDQLQSELGKRGVRGRDVEFHMNLIACGDDWDTGTWTKDADNRCQEVAYATAVRLRSGGVLPDIESGRLARLVSAAFSRAPQHGQVDRCTVEEDWSWSYQ